MMSVPTGMLTAIIGGGVAGILLGLIYFAHVQRTTEQLVRRGLDLSIAGQTVVRIVVALAVFVLLARWSPAAAIAGLVGFSLARHRVLSKKGFS